MMTSALTLPAPRRKARVREEHGAPLPLPSTLPHPPCTHYEATYSQGNITVRDPRQAEALWRNGYYGHGAAAAGSGRTRGKKKWRLVEAEGLKSGKWFKEAAGWRGGKGGVEEREEEEEEEEEENSEIQMKDLNKEEKREDEELGKMEEVKEENIDKEEEEEEEEEKIINEEEKEMEKETEKETPNTENDTQQEEEEEEEEEGKIEEEGNRNKQNTNTTLESSQSPKHNYEEEKEEKEEEEEDILSGNEEEPKSLKTLLVLSQDQRACVGTPNTPSYLTLLPEEALFLSYALGCLVLTYQNTTENPNPRKRGLGEHNSDAHEMTIDEMWRVFTGADPSFPVKYAAFHHFRTQGWVVKAGLKYGVDYVLYPVGPPFYHSQYAVKVHSVWADTLALDHTLPGHAITWTTIATTHRLTHHINKTAVVCFVLRPRSLNPPRLAYIECLKDLKVQELVLGRWNPNDATG